MHVVDFRAPSPPPKRQRLNDDFCTEIPNVLQGEIARLEHRFKINLDPLYHSISRTAHLICRLGKDNLLNSYHTYLALCSSLVGLVQITYYSHIIHLVMLGLYYYLAMCK